MLAMRQWNAREMCVPRASRSRDLTPTLPQPRGEGESAGREEALCIHRVHDRAANCDLLCGVLVTVAESREAEYVEVRAQPHLSTHISSRFCASHCSGIAAVVMVNVVNVAYVISAFSEPEPDDGGANWPAKHRQPASSNCAGKVD